MIIHDEDDVGKNKNNNSDDDDGDDRDKSDDDDDDDDDKSWKGRSENLKSAKLGYLHIHSTGRMKSEMWISTQNLYFIPFHQYSGI